MKTPEISIVIACRNEREHIEDFVGSVLSQQTGRYTMEVLVADGISTDGTRELLVQLCASDSRVTVLDNPGRIVSTGLNAAIGKARGEFIVRMDAHTIYAPDYVRQSVDTLQKTNAANAGGPARTSASTYWGKAVAAAYHSPFACGGARFHNVRFAGYVDTVPYGCWRRSMLVTLGGFDESLVRNQDDGLNLRIIRAGGRVYQSPDIVSWYKPRSSLSALFRQYMQYGFWKVAVIRKHQIPASFRHLVPGLFVVTVIGLALTWAGLAVVGATAAPLVGAVVVAVLLLYSAAAAAASVRTAATHGWDLLPVLPLVFATYHTSYGLGFLSGLLHFSRKSTAVAASSRFATLSR